MHHRHAFSSLALLAVLIVPPAQAGADPVLPFVIQIDEPGSEAPQSLAACSLAPAPLGVQFFVFVNDHWTSHYTLLRPSTCLGCPAPQSLDLRSTTFRVRWGSGSCPTAGFDVELSIVGTTTGGAPGCLVPDPTNVLCGPTLHSLTPPVPAAPQIVTLPLPSGCCINQPAFLRVRYLNLTGVPPCVPITNTDGVSCDPCEQYYTTLNGAPTPTDPCPQGGSVQQQWFSVDAECCQATPTLPASWGKLKSLYR